MSDEPSWGIIAKRLTIIVSGMGAVMLFMWFSASTPSTDDATRGTASALILGAVGWWLGTLKS